MWSGQDPPLAWQPTGRRASTATEVLPEEQGDQTPHLAPRPGEDPSLAPCTGKTGLHNVWLWLGELEDIGNQDSALKGSMQKNPLALSPSSEAAIWKALRSYMKEIHWLILGHVLEGQGSVGIFSRYRMCWWVSFLLSLSTLASISLPQHLPENSLQLVLHQRGPLPCHTEQVALASIEAPPKWIPPQGLALHTRAPAPVTAGLYRQLCQRPIPHNGAPAAIVAQQQ